MWGRLWMIVNMTEKVVAIAVAAKVLKDAYDGHKRAGHL